MKISNKIAALALMITGFAFQANAQTDDAGATATVVDPITLTKTVDMAFGLIVPDGVNPTTVVLNNADGVTSADGAILVGGTVTSAAFDVGGSDEAYTITLPTDTDVVLTNAAADEMTVTEFTDSKGGSGTIASGSDSFTVGAKLNLIAAQPKGDYTGTVTVSVAYQ